MPVNSDVNGHLRDLYVTMFKGYFKLPDEVGRLKPRMVFALLEGF